MDKRMIRGSLADCVETDLSAADTEGRLLSIDGVYEVSGEFGSPLGSTETTEIIADMAQRDVIKPQVKNYVGGRVLYHWVKPRY